ncbi:MAG: endonuclease/exonuclease/phosphatase family protein [Spirochaetaceae bacterium]|jgi:endonuclease/exonuclease/phosphatase family metal-dependent hydrolase|nr:endonuclease/exonuclease/phosphatase family protein [Spirochaetaceae bacterium]
MSKPVIIITGIAAFLVLVLLAAGGLLLWLTVHEYKPEDRESISLSRQLTLKPARGQPVELYSWNIGYGSLDAGQDFFMDGGKGVRPATDRNVGENIWAIQAFLAGTAGDIIFLQEVDAGARRSYGFDEAAYFSESWKGSSAFALNYKCPFVPVPFPRFMGKVESGLLTLNSYGGTAERIALPGAFSWPVRLGQLKRCLLVERLPVQDSDAELVLVNLHLDAFDDGSGRVEQTRALAELLAAEYAKGNYCVAGGDFNQVFPEVKDAFPVPAEGSFIPGTVDGSLFGEGWILAADPSAPSCRSLDKPYDGNRENHQFYSIDGFILSPNVELLSVQVQDLDFKNSDHNPAKLVFSLK